MTSMTAAEMSACDHTIEGSGSCSSECAAFVAKVSSGSKCMESVMSVREVVAHAANQTCADSGKGFAIFFAMAFVPDILLQCVFMIVLFHDDACHAEYI